MKIIHLIFSLRTGGAENMLIDIINEQVLHAEVTLYIVNDVVNYDILRRLSEKATVKQLNRMPGSGNPLPLVSLNAYLLREQCDIIHCHNYNMIDVLLPLFRKKTILTIHDTIKKRVDFTKYNKCFAISHAVRESVSMYSQIDSIVIQNGIAFNAIKSRQASGKEQGLFRILQISRLNHLKKGQHTAIRALSLLKKKGITGVQLDFIGEGDSAEYLQLLATENEVAGQIKFLGLKDRTYVYQQLRQYDLLIQPSLYEGFGLTVVEAMAAKVPVLVSAIEGPMEIIEHGQYGYFFEKENADDMAAKIEGIMNTETMQLQTLVDEAYLYAKDRFDIRNTALNYLREYKKYA